MSSPEPHQRRRYDPETGALSWTDAEGGYLMVRPVIRPATEEHEAVAIAEIAGHQVSLWDARMIASYLEGMYRELDW